MILFICLFALLNSVMSQIPNCQTIETQWNATCADKVDQCEVADMSATCKTLKTYYKQQICCDKDKTSLANLNTVAVNILDGLKQPQNFDFTSDLLIQGVIATDSSVGAIAWNTWLNSNTVTEQIVDDIKDGMIKNNITDFQLIQVGNMIKVVFDDRTPTRRLLNHREVLKNNLNEFKLFDKNKMNVSFKLPHLEVTNGEKTLVQNIVNYHCEIITSQDNGTDFVQNSDGDDTEDFCVGADATCPKNYGYYPFGTCSGCDNPDLNGEGTKYKCYDHGGIYHTGCTFKALTDIGGECHKCPSNKRAFGGFGFDDSFSGCIGGDFGGGSTDKCNSFKNVNSLDDRYVCPGDDFGDVPNIGDSGRIKCSGSEETNNKENCPENRLGGLDINSVRL